MRRTHPWRSASGAFTLVELLVVIAILVILLAATIPTMRTSVKDREIREAARQINVMFNRAKSLAQARGRPVGVWIERLTGTPSASLQLFIAEVPPPYSGDLASAQATVGRFLSPPPPFNGYIKGFYADINVDIVRMISLNIGMGDFIKFDLKGPLYRITQRPVGAPGSGKSRVAFDFPFTTPWPSVTPLVLPGLLRSGMPYQIFRRPRKSSTSPLQLPGSVVIDLENSGFGAKGYDFHAFHPSLGPPSPPLLDPRNFREIIITFSPGGKVDYVYYGGNALGGVDAIVPISVRPIGSIHLLVGHIDQLASANPPELSEFNLADSSNLWVSITAQSGRITTSENRGLSPLDLQPQDLNLDFTDFIPPQLNQQRKQSQGDYQRLVWRARTFAVQSQSMGGR